MSPNPPASKNHKKRKSTSQLASKKAKKSKFSQDSAVIRLIEKKEKVVSHSENADAPTEKKDLVPDVKMTDAAEKTASEATEVTTTTTTTTTAITSNDDKTSKKKRKPRKKKAKKSSADKLIAGLEAVSDPFAPISQNQEDTEGKGNNHGSRKRKFAKSKERAEKHSKNLERTIFVGNVPFRPLIENPKQLSKRLKKHFGGSEFVENIRLRSMPVIVDEEDAIRHKQSDELAAFTTKLGRDTKIHLNQFRTRELKFDDDYYEVTAYLTLKTEDLVKEYVKRYNRTEFEKSILTVDAANADGLKYSETIQAKTAVLGCLPPVIKTKEIYDAFEAVEGIHSIRVVRDPKTRLSRGIAYIHFMKRKQCKIFISRYKEVRFMGRTMPISRFEPDKQQQQRSKHLHKTWLNRNKNANKDDSEIFGGRFNSGNQHQNQQNFKKRGKPTKREIQEKMARMPEKFWQGNKAKEKVNKRHKKLFEKLA